MAKKQRPSNVTFVDVKLTEKQKAALEKDAVFKSEFWKALDLFSAENLRVTVRWDDYNACGLCSVQDNQAAFGDETTIWVLRSGSMSGALLKMCYFFAVVSDRTLPAGASRQEIESDEGLW